MPLYTTKYSDFDIHRVRELAISSDISQSNEAKLELLLRSPLFSDSKLEVDSKEGITIAQQFTQAKDKDKYYCLGILCWLRML